MTKVKTYLNRWPFFLMMFFFWILFNFNLNLDTVLYGVIISLLMTLFTSQVLYDEKGYRYQRIRWFALIQYFFMLIIEIFKAAFMYILSILKGGYEVIVFDLKLSLTDPIEIALIANSITLTPGTVSLDVNGPVITVLAVAKKGTPIADIEQPIRQQFEKVIKKAEQV